MPPVPFGMSTYKPNEAYEDQEYLDSVDSSSGQRLAQFAKAISLARKNSSILALETRKAVPCIIYPHAGTYQWWTKFVLIWAMYSSFFTPLEFGFFRGLPSQLWVFDIVAQIVFFADIIMTFFVAYKDATTYKWIDNHRSIAIRYARRDLVLDLLACCPWDILYKMTGRREGIRYLLWIRLYRIRKVDIFFQNLEKDIRVSYFVARIAKLIVVELYCTHTAACIFYYLATTVPVSQAGYTWIGSLRMGTFDYEDFHNIDLGKRYVTSLYWAIITMATVGYGDIHAVNAREMVFVMVFVSFDMILGAYLIGNMTALIVKGSSTEKFRDKMTNVVKYMNRHRLQRDTREQLKNHVRLQYERQLTEDAVLEGLPVSIRAKISRALYFDIVTNVPLFEGCSMEFINQIVTKLHEEYFLPGEIVLERGHASDQLYIVSHGKLEEILDESGRVLSLLDPCSTFGEIAALCCIPQPYTVRVSELSAVLRLDKEAFSNILQLHFLDSRQVMDNLLQKRLSDHRIKPFSNSITSFYTRQQSELVSRMNNAAYQGDLDTIRSLTNGGVDPGKADYAGVTPLHLASSRGHDSVVLFLIDHGANVNALDNFGNSPLLEATKGKNDTTAALLSSKGAQLLLHDPGAFLCNTVAKGNLELLERLLGHGVDPNSTDDDHRTALHIAAARGLNSAVDLLLAAGANIFAKDRWGHTPLDESKRCGSVHVISTIEKASRQFKSSGSVHEPLEMSSEDMTGKVTPSTNELKGSCGNLQSKGVVVADSGFVSKKRCIIFSYCPWMSGTKRRMGKVVFVPDDMEKLLQTASKLFGGNRNLVLSEAGGEITSVDLILNNEKLYVVEAEDCDQLYETSLNQL